MAKKQHAILVPASEHSLVDVVLDFEASLENLQKAVGGYIEVVRMTDAQMQELLEEVLPLVQVKFGMQTKLNLRGAVLLVNEDGISQDLELNEAISNIVGRAILGNVIVTFLE